jgi:hypothetical protein
MGCGSSTHAHAVHVPQVVPMKDDSNAKAALVEAPMEMTDDERSKHSTPLTTHQGELGSTSPSDRKSDDDAPSIASSSPILSPHDNNDKTNQQARAEPLPAPLDVDAMQLPQATEDSVPYWERLAPLPPLGERPGTSSRRPQNKSGKIVVYETQKQKKLKAEAKKKRDAEGAGSSPSHKLPPVPGARVSALPPLKERKRKGKKAGAAEEDSTLVLAPVKGSRNWKGTDGGEAWEVAVAEVAAESTPQPEVLKFDSPVKQGAGDTA